MTERDLILLATKARENSYSPYSHYKVGVALLCKNGKVYLGTNVENSSYGATNCAERSAIFSAISNGDRDFEAIAIVGSSDDICHPCGVCRQVMSELLPDAKIICAENENNYKVYTTSALLPDAFGKRDTDCTQN